MKELDLNHCDLPVRAALPELFSVLQQHGSAVLSAAPGAGKTTLVPPALLRNPDYAGGLMILTEPRRVAVRAAARRIAALLGEEPGESVGYQVRGESKRGPRTRLLVVTEGILLRRIQDDPELSGVATLIFDEFHERNLDADLALALALDLRRNLRPELRLLVMSATLETDAVSRLLDQAPVVDAPGRQFPIEQRWSETFADPRRPAPAVARAVAGLLAEKPGDLLAFLPGLREIDECAELLRATLPPEVLLLKLHGTLSGAEQDRALAPPPPGCRKVILATNVAESSLTIDGVTLVVDSGLEKRMRFHPADGLPALETVRISKASATQRTGRAGRTAPGVAVRLWSELEHRQLAERTAPEILEADLTPLALEVAAWGAKEAELSWIDPPPAAALSEAKQTLRALGAFDSDNRLTVRGRQLAALPVHPRIGMMLLRAQELQLLPLATELAALLEERDDFRRYQSADLHLRLEAMRCHPHDFSRQAAIRRQLLGLLGLLGAAAKEQNTDSLGLLTAFAYPDWIARARTRHGESYVLSGGKGGRLPDHDPLAGNEFLAIARLEGGSGREPAIRLAAALSEGEIRAHFSDQIHEVACIEYDPERDRATGKQEERLGAIPLKSRPLDHPPPGALPRAVLESALARSLPLPPPEAKAANALLHRVRFAHRLDDTYPDWGDHCWAALLPELALPFLNDVRTLRDLARADWLLILRTALGYDQLRELDREYPEHFTTPVGSTHRIDYDAETPTLSVRVQELYGVTRHPSVGKSQFPLRLELLSPAHRPVQVTTDLPGFWHGNWPLVQKEMRGRYPKHFWPDDPAAAPPTTRTKAKMTPP